MGRRRNIQKQTSRIYYRERDHREVITEDSYHGAMYLPEQVEPVWRRYKPRLVMGNVISSLDDTDSYFVAVDVENKYFTMLTNNYRRNSSGIDRYELGAFNTNRSLLIVNKDIIWCSYIQLYDLDRPEYAAYGMISRNGYDWKLLPFYPLPPGIYGNADRVFGDGYFIGIDDRTYGSQIHDIYNFNYQNEEKLASIEHIGEIHYADSGHDNTFTAPINTDQFSGYLNYKTTQTSERRGGTYYYTWKYDVNAYDFPSNSWTNIYHINGASNVPQSQQAYVDRMMDVPAIYYFNNHIFFITNWYVRSQSTGMMTQRLICVSSDISNINLNSWNESEFLSWTYSTTTSLADYYVYRYHFVTIRNNKVYLYMMHQFPNYIFKWSLFVSSDLNNWEEITLPDYLDIPFFQEDNSNNRYGVVVESQYDYIRIPVSSSAVSDVPSNTLLATNSNYNIFGNNMGYGGAGITGQDPRSDVIWFEVLDGKITTDILTEDLWLFDVCPNTIIYIDNMTFSNSSNNCAYSIYQPNTIHGGEYDGYNIIPYKETIDESDYIFD